MTSRKPGLRVVLSGGSGGIGGAIVDRLRAEGAHVVNLDRIEPAPQRGRRRGRLDHVDVDLADAAAIGAAFEQVDRLFEGRAPDVLVCAASIGMTHHVLEVTAEQIDTVNAINIRGTLLLAQAAALRMRAAGGGRIVVITSISAYQAWAQEPLYGITKAAQHGLVQALAIELAPFNIQVNAVAPGVVDVKSKGMSGNRSRPEIAAHYLDLIPARRFCQPEEVAEAIWQLAHATYMTGQALTIDGGLMANGLAYIGSLRDDVLARLERTLPAPRRQRGKGRRA